MQGKCCALALAPSGLYFQFVNEKYCIIFRNVKSHSKSQWLRDTVHDWECRFRATNKIKSMTLAQVFQNVLATSTEDMEVGRHAWNHTWLIS